MDNLTYDDYIEIYQELRQRDDSGKYGLSVRVFIKRIGSKYSTGQWSKFHNRKLKHVPHEMRTELRKAVGLPDAPLDAQDIADMIAKGKVPFRMVSAESGVIAEIVVKGPKKQRPRQRTATFKAEVGDKLNQARLSAGLSWNEIAEIALKAIEN